MHPGGMIILNSCVAGLAKDDAKSIAAQLARGSGCRVAASMEFTEGDIIRRVPQAGCRGVLVAR
jgi:hypothetical protein